MLPTCFGVVLNFKKSKNKKPNMDWNTKILRNNNSSFVSHPLEISSNNLIHNSNQFGRFPGLEVAQHHVDPIHEMLVASNVMNTSSIMERKGDEMMIMRYGKNKEKIKRRLSSKQLESLESSFEEERKLDPDRKMKLAKELGLQPRQVAVWFQNRRARWKAKKLEHLYDVLQQEFDVVSKEKQMLQHEVQLLKSMLMEQGTKKQVNSGNTEASCEETVESTSTADHNMNNINNATEAIFSHNKVDTHYLFNNVDVYNNNTSVSPSYWSALA